MSEPPVYTPPEEKKGELPQGQPAGYLQGQPAAYPQGQPAIYPQGQPGAYPQGQPAAYPQGQPGAYPQGQPAAYPQGQPGAYPQGQPGAYPQGQPAAYQQGQPGAYPQGQPVVYQQGQPAAYQPGQQQVVVINQPGNANQSCCGGPAISEYYNEKVGFATGVVHLVIGVLCIFFGGGAYALPNSSLQNGYGIWSAIIFFIPTGILGVVSKKKNTCVIIAYMVFAIITIFNAIGMLSYEIRFARLLSWYYYCYTEYIGYDANYVCHHSRSTGVIIVHSILALLALAEFIVCIVSAVICCRGLACCCAPRPTNQAVTTTVTYGQPQAQPTGPKTA